MGNDASSESSRPPANTPDSPNGPTSHTNSSARDVFLILTSGLAGVAIVVWWKPLLGLSAIILLDGWPLAVGLLMIYGMYRLVRYLTTEDTNRDKEAQHKASPDALRIWEEGEEEGSRHLCKLPRRRKAFKRSSSQMDRSGINCICPDPDCPVPEHTDERFI